MKATALTLGIVLTMTSAFAANGEIKCSKKVSARHEKLILRDIERLKSLPFASESDEESLKILGVDDINSHTMHKWLTDRVQYVIDDREPIEKLKLDIAERFYSYENASIIPDMETPGLGPVFIDNTRQKGQAVTVMSNVGTVLYLAGKSSKQLLQVKIPLTLFKSDKIRVTSPRTGVIQIGEGLFLKQFMFDEKNEDALSSTLSRLMTFFHEARHSDGNGKSLGFLHAICPPGHDYAGLNACDRNLNGPYSVGKVMAKEFLKACPDCSEAEREKIRLSMLDSESRVIKVTKIPGPNNGQSVSMLKTMIDMYEKLLPLMKDEASKQEYLRKIAELRSQIDQIELRSGNSIEVPSKFWDARPEGQRS
ncbi:MAG: hypothetical protein OHK0056_09140 [Bacteriovoracaceae bacterium]